MCIMPKGKLSSGFTFGGRDHPTAHHEIAFVEHNRLTGRRRPLWGVEDHLDSTPPRTDGRSRRLVAMTNLRPHPAWLDQLVDADPVHLMGHEHVDLDLAGAPHHDGIPGWVELRDVHGPPRAEPETAALTHRVRSQSRVLAEYAAVAIYDRSGRKGLGDASAEKAAVVVVWNEANLLAFGLLRRHQPERTRARAHLGLGERADRKPRGREL